MPLRLTIVSIFLRQIGISAPRFNGLMPKRGFLHQNQAYPPSHSLICGFCSSAQDFALDFLQIPPRDGHPCLKLMVATAKLLFMPGALEYQGLARGILFFWLIKEKFGEKVIAITKRIKDKFWL